MAKHLTYDDRLEIERYLKSGYSLSAISRDLHRHKSTISKEILLRSDYEKKGCYGRNYNACKIRYGCDLSGLCDKRTCKVKSKGIYKHCRFCSYCNDNCEYFQEEVCERLESLPCVCNGCKSRNNCILEKRFYKAKAAQLDYMKLLVDSRTGISISPEEIERLNGILKPLVDKGHSIHHILANNRSTIMLSEKTIYRYIEIGALSVKNIDLPRKVRYRPRKKIQMGYKVDKKCL